MTHPRRDGGTSQTVASRRWLRRATQLHVALLCGLATACRPDWTVIAPPPQGSNEPQVDRNSALPDLASICSPRPAAAPAKRCSQSGDDPALPPCEQWIKVQPEGAVCGNGSPYKFFINYSGTSDNLLVMFEPGGACFDYDSCTRSKLGAVNPDGIPDDHMAQREPVLNLLQRTDANPVSDWNMVFVSYCTGDVHGGDRVATYPAPDGGPSLTYHHVGAQNTQAVLDFLVDRFSDVPQLLVTGCSAGGTGATQNYALVREALGGVQCGYLLDDSGPIFSSDGPSHTLHVQSRAAWNLDPLLAKLETLLEVEPGAITSDFGRLNTALADHYPRDRFAVTAYQRDLNYSLYSYAVFTPDISLEEIQTNWQIDLSALREQYESRPNMGYYMPYFRSDNCSHCATIVPLGHDVETRRSDPWLGSEIAADATNLRGFIAGLLDDGQPIGREFETDQTSDFTAEQALMCLPER